MHGNESSLLLFNHVIFFYTVQTTSLLKHMNGLGIRDGITKGLDQSVDGLSLETHLEKLAQIASVCSN